MARLIRHLIILILHCVFMNCSKRFRKEVYKPYGHLMCKELREDLDNAFIYSTEDLSCRKIRGHHSGITEMCADTNSSTGLNSNTMTTSVSTLAISSERNNSGTHSEAGNLCNLSWHRTRQSRHMYMKSLHAACKEGELCCVKLMLSRRLADINGRCKCMSRRTPVMTAAKHGQREVFDYLVSQGCNLTLRDKFNNTVLHSACDGGNVDIVRTLNKSFDINARGRNRWTPVMRAALRGHKDVFFFLVDQGCDLTLTGSSKCNVLHMACVGGQVDVVKHVLSKDMFNFESKCFVGRTPLMMAAEYGHRKVVEMLIGKGCNLRVLDKDGNSILHVACLGKADVGMVEYILSLKLFDVDSKESHGRTPLMMAAEKGQREIFDFLIRKGSNLTKVDKNNNNILHVAVLGGQVHMVEYILSQNMSDIDGKGNYDQTPVLRAAQQGQMNIVELLVGKGCNVSVVDTDRNNIFHTACRGGNPDIVKYLLTNEVEGRMARNILGKTPEQVAVSEGYRAVAALLMEAGARSMKR